MACPTCGGMFANNTKFLDHIRRQTSLDRKQSERKGVWGQALLLGVGVQGMFPGKGGLGRHLQLSRIYPEGSVTCHSLG